MRTALCRCNLITAGALIGLGLTALGYGLRYGGICFGVPKSVSTRIPTRCGAHSSLMVILIVLLIALLIGLGTAFLGLAFHHYRRYQEHLREMGRHRRKPRRQLQVGVSAPRCAVE